jgi:hypothetical protein
MEMSDESCVGGGKAQKWRFFICASAITNAPGMRMGRKRFGRSALRLSLQVNIFNRILLGKGYHSIHNLASMGKLSECVRECIEHKLNQKVIAWHG